ncbi:MAG: PilZ domain-containing protein [Candidatus Omnitrophica bacterium]|nr:PilZ domain-containing protein [Candidatus Omnitrophota bacterium]
MRDKKSTKSKVERRKFQRLSLPLKVSYKITKAGRVKKGEADCIDFSGGGICIRVKEDFKIGEKLELSCSLEGRQEPISVKARVVWSVKEAGANKNGLQFLNVEHRDDFLDFFCENLTNMLANQEINEIG